MNPEEYLDSLIERRKYEKTQLFVSDKEIASRQVILEAFARSQEIEIPQEFADRLELRLRTHIRGLAQKNSGAYPVTEPRPHTSSFHVLTNHSWSVGLRLVAILLIFCVSILTVTVYGLHGAFNLSPQKDPQAILTFTNHMPNQAYIQMAQLQDALTALSTTISKRQSDQAIQQALTRVITQTNNSHMAVNALPNGTERNSAQQDFDRLLLQEKQFLHQQLLSLDWNMRVAFSQRLAALDYPVPIIKQVVVNKQKNGTIFLTVTGANFDQSMKIFVNGQRERAISKNTATQYIFVINSSIWSPDINAVEVLNPDASAAQVMIDGDIRTSPINNSGTATPISSSTPSTYSFGTPTPVPTDTPPANNQGAATPTPTDTPPANNPGTATPVPSSTPPSGGGGGDDNGGNGYPPTPGPGDGGGDDGPHDN